MTPSLAQDAKIKSLLQGIYAPGMHFPESQVAAAQRIVAKYEASNWGAPARPEPDTGSPTASSPSRRRSSTQQDQLRPHPDDPVWGRSGIMHGLAIKVETMYKAYNRDPEVEKDKRDHMVYGHNGHKPGAWFPYQLKAAFDGCHGSSQSGISGDTTNGAVSIVVAGGYDGIDDDKRDTILYSGPEAMTSEAQDEDDSKGSKMLRISKAKGKPVRVLRTESNAPWAPSAGFRYDGLYKVTEQTSKENGQSGKYWLFTLKRLNAAEDTEGQQGPLDDCYGRPTLKDQEDLKIAKAGFSDGFPGTRAK
ncbi:E3 ubiquitin-protein ligase ORTHRUS 3 [Pseudocercospora fuligena]|uniref:E3 ubiquitin-protein ligase ORTHRUS 3 n=1 Tax=Pseudocercospora fuligena TaxID=685502 RepID=A0A8H6VHA4_9PEZI|nr:E3 ubiquitin-protein ligase ORTHRUS 3 [Pseudocercospora fuligena]